MFLNIIHLHEQFCIRYHESIVLSFVLAENSVDVSFVQKSQLVVAAYLLMKPLVNCPIILGSLITGNHVHK